MRLKVRELKPVLTNYTYTFTTIECAQTRLWMGTFFLTHKTFEGIAFVIGCAHLFLA